MTTQALQDRSLLAELSDFVADRLGLFFPEDRWPDLARGVAAASKELGFAGADARWLNMARLSDQQTAALAKYLTVGETYFFRDPDSFEWLERHVLPSLVAERADSSRSLRLWSAGCCTGEEAYSLAISCSRVVPDRQNWSVYVLGTDLNETSLEKARAGLYSDWSFRSSPESLQARYFTSCAGKKWQILPEIRSMVE